MTKFIEITDRQLGVTLINVGQIEAVLCSDRGTKLELTSGGQYIAIDTYSTIKRKLIPVEEPVHNRPGGERSPGPGD